jgi:hypothetical protein
VTIRGRGCNRGTRSVPFRLPQHLLEDCALVLGRLLLTQEPVDTHDHFVYTFQTFLRLAHKCARVHVLDRRAVLMLPVPGNHKRKDFPGKRVSELDGLTLRQHELARPSQPFLQEGRAFDKVLQHKRSFGLVAHTCHACAVPLEQIFHR